MPARRRIAPPGGVPRRAVTFSVDGRAVRGLEGESVAASLLAAGRSTLSRSFRFHRPRGLMCDTGRCGWCACRIDGRPSVHACQVPVREGLVVESEHAWPSVAHDAFSLLGVGARFVSPTFYHHRFLRPRRLRRRYLDVLRALGGRGRLTVGGVARPAGPRSLVRATVDVLVVGGGEAGRRAAMGASEAGAAVMLIDEHPSVGAGAAPADDTPGAGVRVLAGMTLIGWYGDHVTAIDAAHQWEIRAGTVVAATGTSAVVPRVRGADRPGVMAARLVSRLLADGIVPGERLLLVGDLEADSAVASLAADLESVGVDVTGPLPTSGLRAVHGRGRVRAATVRLDGRDRRIRVDGVVFADREPVLDLPLAAGARLRPVGGALIPDLDDDGATSVPHLFVAGGAAGRPIRGEADGAAAHAVGAAAARAAGSAPAATRGVRRPSQDTRPGDPPRPFTGVAVREGDSDQPHPTRPRLDPDAIACYCEDVHVREIAHECATGYGDPELVKRRTGALTGPCQGAFCLAAVHCAMAAAGGYRDGPEPGSPGLTLPTARPPLSPVRLADLVAHMEPGDEAPGAAGSAGPGERPR